jgi:hypothetical protein
MDPRLAELIRRAYFFGAKDHLDYLSKHYTGGNMPNEADLQMGKEIHDELREFAREVFPMLMADRQRKHRIN